MQPTASRESAAPVAPAPSPQRPGPARRLLGTSVSLGLVTGAVVVEAAWLAFLVWLLLRLL